MGSSTEDNMNKQELTQYLIDNKLTIKEIDNLPEGWTKVINYFYHHFHVLTHKSQVVD